MMPVTRHSPDFGPSVLDFVSTSCLSNASSVDRSLVKSFHKSWSRAYRGRRLVCCRQNTATCRVYSTKTPEAFLEGVGQGPPPFVNLKRDSTKRISLAKLLDVVADDLQTRKHNLQSGRFRSPAGRQTHHGFQVSCRRMTSLLAVTALPTVCPLPAEATVSINEVSGIARAVEVGTPTRSGTLPDIIQTLLLADLDPATAKMAIGILGPFLSAFAFLFILRIVMSWYPKLPVGKFPYILAYAPTEPLLIPSRKLIPPVGGVDVTPVVWFAIVSFLNEIFLGPQGLLVLVSQQVI